MALRISHAALPQAQLRLGFPSPPQFLSIAPPLKFSLSSSTFRCKVFRRLKVNQRLLTVFATNPNSVDGKSPKEGSDVNETSNASQGPPLLTILAGFFVLFVVCWSIWSIIAWLISLIVTAPAPK
ncbi:uncharacterized protein HKW66_Vig0208740 [Vigna angularis]|uniref:Uncharacterized protein n=3 Tax=Phaseolus angularis TaxID=3914 RepID=A0A8T0JHJ5_PHAAN|nr:uncharacterized protein LOC108333363 [Vigna angularis]KAG2372258.1 uncharacterized protein HKW66_Vig0208740 [Vigna angularis]BAT93064.1 hypothetical protein VIGAN_07195800 [Vigna angularis var. angularis]